jgi:hypothetical protein
MSRLMTASFKKATTAVRQKPWAVPCLVRKECKIRVSGAKMKTDAR